MECFENNYILLQTAYEIALPMVTVDIEKKQRLFRIYLLYRTLKGISINCSLFSYKY